MRAGRLTLTTPDGIRRRFEGPQPGPAAELVVRDWRALGAMLRRAEIGVFTSWRDGWIATPDMTALLELCARNEAALREVFYGNPLAALLLRIAHALRPNTRAGSRRNIHAHYDLGNDFYALWLDRGMSYSSGLFSGTPDLETAQEAKYERLLDLLEVDASHEVLEIGCGWGAFAERAARSRGCHVTGVTISQAQLEYARSRIRRAGLEDRVDLHFRDYRDVDGQFDRIVSIEMVEAVGERYWPTYFRTLRERLKPGGRAALQSIVVAEDAFARYRRSSDFIREYVFPGGMLPSVSRFVAEAEAAGLEAHTPFLFGRDYAQTVRRWRAAFDAREAEIRALGFDDRFLATWRFYFHYCEAGFDSGRVDVMQIELARPR
jgi:cyclopropane-fatty-acyl-phospholipid synthase